MDEKPAIALKHLPNQPGVYKYYNKDEELIYVGKAKDIKKRVSSYFNKQSRNNLKTKKLVSQIVKVDYIIVDTEYDALLLENNLIKQNQPRFNILLKDDKSYPFICITKERFPKIFTTRRYEPCKGTFYGPYTSVKAVNNVLQLIRSLYRIRTCTYLLSEKNINDRKFKVCLEYHIGNCRGPCENHQTEQDYEEEIKQARHIIKGNLKVVKDIFKAGMLLAANNLNFEDAQLLKNKLDLLDKFQSKTVIINRILEDVDVITISSSEQKAFINYMHVDNGIINISESISINKKLEESDSQILSLLLIELRERFKSQSKLILSNITLYPWSDTIEMAIPQIGDKKKLIALSLKNVLHFKKEALLLKERQRENNNRVTKTLQEDLNLKTTPNHIECFDNSNIQGTNPVASMVCFKNGKPAKKDYRHYKVKTIIGPDDFGSMTEIVGRRYKRLKEEGLPFPDLIVIDGGKGQLSAACKALKELDLYSTIPIIGIAKRLEEIYVPEDSIPIHISKKSESLQLIQRLRDEAHRFAITFHRNLRSKSQIQSELDNIKGFGDKTKTKLLNHYKSYNNIVKASNQEVADLIGTAKTQLLINYKQKKGSN